MNPSAAKLDFKNNIYKPELDLLRGLAAVFMVINHMGFLLLSSADISASKFIAYLLDLTSNAPVLFFFATGVGSGMQSVSKSSQFQFRSVLYKFGLLMLADLFFALNSGFFFGLDFLGFIGISVLILELVRCSRKPIIVCVAGILIIFALRYVIGPKLNIVGDSTTLLAIKWALGVNAIAGVSYPMSPWLTYPLLGYLFGAFWIKNTPLVDKKNLTELTLAAFTLLFALFAFYLDKRGFTFFRWGTVSFGFYVLSFSVILLTALATLRLHILWSEKRPKLFYLGGTASLAIVPIHYLILHILKNFLPDGLSTMQFYCAAIIALPLFFIMANGVNLIGKKMPTLSTKPYTLPTIWLLVATSALVTYHFHASASMLALLGSTLGQLLICLLFSVRLKKA